MTLHITNVFLLFIFNEQTSMHNKNHIMLMKSKIQQTYKQFGFIAIILEMLYA